jgi:hypothetical protein
MIPSDHFAALRLPPATACPRKNTTIAVKSTLNACK